MFNNSGKDHTLSLIKAGRRAFYGLQGECLFCKGVNTDTAVHTWNAAVKPVLMYGCECIHISKASFNTRSNRATL